MKKRIITLYILIGFLAGSIAGVFAGIYFEKKNAKDTYNISTEFKKYKPKRYSKTEIESIMDIGDSSIVKKTRKQLRQEKRRNKK